VLRVPGLCDLHISEVKAPVAHVSSLRFIARSQGIVTLKQLLDRAAVSGVVPFDIEPGVTLARVVEYLLNRPSRTVVNASRYSASSPKRTESSDNADARDSIDDLNDSIDDLRETMTHRGTSQWASDALNEYIARIRCPFRLPAGAGLSSASCLDLVIRSVRRLQTGMDEGHGQLLSDLGDAMSIFGERDGRLARALIGVDNEHAMTLEEVGVREGVSRERIRQLFDRFRSRASLWRPPLAALTLLQEAIDRAGPIVTEFELAGALPPGVLSDISELRVLEGLLRLGWLTGLTKSQFRGVWVRDVASLPLLAQYAHLIRRKANRPLRRWGALDLTEYEDLVGDDGPGLLYSLVMRGRSYDVIDGWLVLRTQQRTVMRDRIDRVASVTSTLSLPRLRRALKKSLGTLPPDEVVSFVLHRDVPDARLMDSETVSFGAEPVGHLSGSESLARNIIQENGGATTVRTLQRHFVREGMSAASGSIVLSRSPILERLSYGVVGLVGGTVGATRVAQLRKQVRREALRALIGFTRVGGAIELLYKLDPMLISSTLFAVPRNLICRGEWAIENQSGCVVVKKTYISGLHRAAKASVESGARRMAVIFRPEAHTVELVPR